MTKIFCDFCDQEIKPGTSIQGTSFRNLEETSITIQVSHTRSGRRAKDVCIRCFIKQLEGVLEEHDPTPISPSSLPNYDFDPEDVRDEEER